MGTQFPHGKGHSSAPTFRLMSFWPMSIVAKRSPISETAELLSLWDLAVNLSYSRPRRSHRTLSVSLHHLVKRLATAYGSGARFTDIILKGHLLQSIETFCHELCRNGWSNWFAILVVDSGGPKEAPIQSYSTGDANVHSFNHIHQVAPVYPMTVCS